MSESQHQLYIECLRLEAQLTQVIAIARRAESYQLVASLETCRRQVGRRSSQYRAETQDREQSQLELLSSRAGRRHDEDPAA